MSWQVGLYVAAVLIPLAAFAVEAIFIRQLKRLNAYIATGAIGLSFLLSLVGFVDYFLVEAEGVFASTTPPARAEPGRRPSTAASTRGRMPPPRPAGLEGRASTGSSWAGARRPADPSAAKPLLRPARRLHRQPHRHHVPDGHVHRHADPHLLDGLHARRPAVSAVLRVPVALLLLDARPGRVGRTSS